MNIILQVIIYIMGLTLFVFADGVIKGDDFAQDDLRVAISLKELHDYYVAQDRRKAELLAAKQDPRDARLAFSSAISTREAEIDKLVGYEKIIELLNSELEKLKATGLGSKHPHRLWLERLITGLEQRAKSKAE